jgi:hypothetical protein
VAAYHGLTWASRRGDGVVVRRRRGVSPHCAGNTRAPAWTRVVHDDRSCSTSACRWLLSSETAKFGYWPSPASEQHKLRVGCSAYCRLSLCQARVLTMGRMGAFTVPFLTRVPASLADRRVWPLRSGRSMSPRPLQSWSGRSRTTGLEKLDGRSGRGDCEEAARQGTLKIPNRPSGNRRSKWDEGRQLGRNRPLAAWSRSATHDNRIC